MAEENGTTIGKAYVQIMPSAKGIKSQLESLLNDNMPDGKKSGTRLGSSFVSGFGNIVKSGVATVAKAGIATITAASAGIGAIVKSSSDAYADYEQNVGGIETLFKDNADTVIKYASEAYKTAGASANDYMENVTSFSASLLQGLGGDTQKAAEIANTAMVDMSDNANKFGTDISSIQNAYQGFAKQNYTMLDNLKLGYGGTQAEMARLINDSGVLGETMTVTADTVNGVSFDKIIEAIHKIQTDMDITGTTVKEASTTISGSFGMVKASWENLLSGLGDKNSDLDSLIGDLVDSVKSYASNLIPVIEQSLSGVTSLISELAPIIADELPGLVSNLLPDLVEAGSSILDTLVKGITDNIDVLSDAFISGVTTIALALINNTGPLVQAATTIITKLAQALPQILPELQEAIIEQIPTIMDAILDSLPIIIESVIQIVTTIASSIVDNIDIIIDGAVQIIDALAVSLSDKDAVAKLTKSALEIIGTLTLKLLDNLPDILASGILLAAELVKGIAQGMVEYFSPVSEALSDMMIDITEWFQKKWSDFKQWGKDLIDNFITGIKEKWNDLKDTLVDFGQTVKDYIGFSEPEKGPLSNFHTFAPDMMDLFAQGIQDNEDMVTLQFNRSLEPIMNTNIIPQSISKLPDLGQVEKSNALDRISNLLETFFPQIIEKFNFTVELDGDKLVGKLVPKIDSKLGEQIRNNERGLA